MTAMMNSRQRILNALNHKESDKIPVDLGATESTSIHVVAYDRLKKYLGINTTSYVPIISHMVSRVELSVTKAVGSDAIAFMPEPEKVKPWVLRDGSKIHIPAKTNIKVLDNGNIEEYDEQDRVLSRSPSGSWYFSEVLCPLENAKTIEEIDAGKPFYKTFDWPDYLDKSFAGLRRSAKSLRENSEHAIVGNLWLHLLAGGQLLRGFENFMVDLMVEKEMAHRLLENLMEVYLKRIDNFIEAVGDYIDIIFLNEDLGTQSAPQLSLELYKEMIKPYQKRLIEHIKKRSNKPVLLHSCGAIYDFIPDLIEIGVDALNPIQVSAVGMDTKKLKREFGKDITFWGGGCDTQEVLVKATPEEVKDEVCRRVEDLAHGGGFVFCQVHNILAEVPVENILAMYEALEKFS